MPAMRTPTRPPMSRTLVVTLACLGLLAALTTITDLYGFSTLALDRAAVREWVHGSGLYAYRSPTSHLGTALTPAAALLVLPAAFLPLPVAGWLLALAGVGALGLALIAHLGPIALRHGRRPWPVVLAGAALALTIEPVRAVLGLGTLDLIVFGLLTADIVALRRAAAARARAPRGFWRDGAWAGAGVGLAAALSPSGWFFLAYLIVSGQRRAAATAALVGVPTLVVPVVLVPHQAGAWLAEVLWHIDRRGPVDAVGNQSLAGVLARLYESSTTPILLWMSFALLLAAVGMIRARAAHQDGDETAAFTLVGLAAALVGPVSRTHELLWVIPAMIVLADLAATDHRARAGRLPRRRITPGSVAAGAAVLTFLLFVLAPMAGLPGPVAQNAYALALILLVNAMPWRNPRLRGS